jgi:O-antigen/teichoic acid export membrane protein
MDSPPEHAPAPGRSQGSAAALARAPEAEADGGPAGRRPKLANASRLLGRGRGASGAVGAQFAQALTSLVLSIAAARSLGADGLGVYGLISGGLVLATAIATGLVGDSLTVLERGVANVRAGLQTVGLGCAVLAGVVGFGVSWAAGLLDWQSAAMFGLGAAAFIAEEFLRRLLMASLKFWSVMVVDLSALAATVIALVVSASLTSLGMFEILLALLASQVVGIATAICLLPSAERTIARRLGGDVASVVRFGGWRAAQQAVRPAMLTTMRVLVAVVAGTFVYGQLEAARVYTAPTLLIVNGIGGFLFATYAAKRHEPLRALVRHADVGAISMFGAVLVAGCVAAALLPWAADVVTGGEFSISVTAAVGWVVYSATAGFLMPYGSLAAVTGMHVRVFTLRLAESAVSLAAVVVVLYPLGASPSWVPAAMAAGPCLLAVIIRQRLLMPRVRRGQAAVDGVSPREATA